MDTRRERVPGPAGRPDLRWATPDEVEDHCNWRALDGAVWITNPKDPEFADLAVPR
jgi:hypothetical protein